MASFSVRLTELRKARSLTQKQLAEAIGANERGIRFYESGAKQPTMDSLVKLARFFHVSLDYLAGLTDNPSTAPSAEPRDLADLLSSDKPLSFAGRPLGKEDREKARRVLEALFGDNGDKQKPPHQ